MTPFKTIKVGPFTVKIKLLSDEDGAKHLGTFRADLMTICLNPKFENEQIEAETLLHEICHAIYYVFGIQAKKDDQERLVSLMSTGMATVFSANPRLLTYFKEKLS